MALKVGTDNKRNVIIACCLFAVVAYLAFSQLTGGPSTPAPAPVSAPQVLRSTPASAPDTLASAPASSAATRTRTLPAVGAAASRLPGLGLDPALHLDKLASSESIEYAGNGRNIFSGESAPVAMPVAEAPARPEQQPEVATGPPPPPQPPAIDLRYFGYSANSGGERKAFLLHGDDIFEAAAGEIVNHRFKIVLVQASSVQVTDLSYNNTQTLPLTTN